MSNQRDQNSQLVKRTFKELDRDWDVAIDSTDADTILAKQSSTSNGSSLSQRRQIKLEKKLISKICRALDILKRQKQSVSNVPGLGQKEQITGLFSTLLFDVQKDYIYQFSANPSRQEQVDNVRLIKTNKDFYNQIMLYFLKFKACYEEQFKTEDMTSSFCQYVCTKYQNYN